jgi:hypothetical protein
VTGFPPACPEILRMQHALVQAFLALHRGGEDMRIVRLWGTEYRVSVSQQRLTVEEVRSGGNYNRD